MNFRRKRPFFLSLKWSALLLITLVLVNVSGFFYQYHRIDLFEDFSHQRQQNFDRNTAQVFSLLEQSRENLTYVSELIPGLYDDGKPFDFDQIQKRFEYNWSSLQAQTDVDVAGIYSPDDQKNKIWGGDTINHEKLVSDMLSHWHKNGEHPTFKIYCFNICRQYVVTTLYAKGVRKGVFFVGRTISDAFLKFSEFSQIDVGLLTDNSGIKQERSIAKRLDHWELDIMALSGFNQNFLLLDKLQTLASLDEINVDGFQLQVGDKTYEVTLQKLQKNGRTFVIFIEDISELLTLVDQDLDEILLYGVLSLVFSELALLMILWSPLSNLRRASEVMPMLARSDFSRVRKHVSDPPAGAIFLDEIDILYETLVELSHQLEQLEINEARRSNDLAEKVTELMSERDFVNNLLNTAQVLIVTHDENGNFLLTNKHIREVSGFTNAEFDSKQFIDLVDDEPNKKLVNYKLKGIVKGSINRYENESILICKNGKQRIIAWLHSPLQKKSSGGAIVLSVGLDVTDRKAYEQEISWLADHDSLTGLHNRRRFNEIIKSSLNIASRYKHNVGLLYLDLDNFKHINDTLGHKTGDMLIRSVADCLKMTLRESDYIARLGGDEFAIILPHINVEDVIDVASKINKHLASLRLPMVNTNHRSSASIGIAMFPDHAGNAEELLSNADLAMYQAKSHGRGCWHLFSKDDNLKKRIETQLYWRHKIIDSLATDKFELHFQPILDISRGEVSHYEALLRMRDEDGQLQLPSPFIEVAEKTGLIHDIDHMVLRKSIDEIQHQAENNLTMKLAINLSAHSFSDPQLLSLLSRLLSISKINPAQIIFEITETAALSDLTGAARLIEKIREMGCSFALDDFGVGFSSFYYLKELPVDYVKIDGSFIQKLYENRNDQILVKAMTEIAREFGKKTIAEFVEDEETLLLLKDYSVDYAQGYHIGRPEELQAA